MNGTVGARLTSLSAPLFFSEGSEFLAEPEIQSLRRYEPVQVQRISTPPTFARRQPVRKVGPVVSQPLAGDLPGIEDMMVSCVGQVKGGSAELDGAGDRMGAPGTSAPGRNRLNCRGTESGNDGSAFFFRVLPRAKSAMAVILVGQNIVRLERAVGVGDPFLAQRGAPAAALVDRQAQRGEQP